MKLYPIRVQPEFHERVWGTRDLSPIYAEAPGKEPIGEVWLTGDNCRVANGPLAGKSLAELARRFGRELIGTAAPQADRFPLLIKFLFPREKLSVQVHPDDATARRIGQPCGKTECWYVLDAEPGAQVALGLKHGTTPQEFAKAIHEPGAEQLLNWIDIHAGELIYVAAGTIHAIGPGSVLVETQQNSDTTYRLYDYGRPRELHVEQGLAALKEITRAGKIGKRIMDGRVTSLVCSPFFRVDKVTLRGGDCWRREDTPGGSSARVLAGLQGCAVVEADSAEPVTLARGEAVVVPASVGAYSLRGQWHAELLCSSVPDSATAEPEASL